MLIPKPEQSAYETADTEIRDMLDRVVSELNSTPSWEQRSAQLLEFIDALELAFDPEEIEDEDLDDDDQDDDFDDDEDSFDDDDEDEDEPAPKPTLKGAWQANGADEDDEEEEGDDADFAELLPFNVGAVLERLNETRIDQPQ